MFQIASQQSRPDPAADTMAKYQSLRVPPHEFEEAVYDSDELA